MSDLDQGQFYLAVAQIVAQMAGEHHTNAIGAQEYRNAVCDAIKEVGKALNNAAIEADNQRPQAAQAKRLSAEDIAELTKRAGTK